MQIDITTILSHGSEILLAIVPSEFTPPTAGPGLIARIQKHRPAMPIMLVSIEDNGPRAFAYFEAHVLLALVQLEKLRLAPLDLDMAPPEAELPF